MDAIDRYMSGHSSRILSGTSVQVSVDVGDALDAIGPLADIVAGSSTDETPAEVRRIVVE